MLFALVLSHVCSLAHHTLTWFQYPARCFTQLYEWQCNSIARYCNRRNILQEIEQATKNQNWDNKRQGDTCIHVLIIVLFSQPVRNPSYLYSKLAPIISNSLYSNRFLIALIVIALFDYQISLSENFQWNSGYWSTPDIASASQAAYTGNAARYHRYSLDQRAFHRSVLQQLLR